MAAMTTTTTALDIMAAMTRLEAASIYDYRRHLPIHLDGLPAQARVDNGGGTGSFTGSATARMGDSAPRPRRRSRNHSPSGRHAKWTSSHGQEQQSQEHREPVTPRTGHAQHLGTDIIYLRPHLDPHRLLGLPIPTPARPTRTEDPGYQDPIHEARGTDPHLDRDALMIAAALEDESRPPAALFVTALRFPSSTPMDRKKSPKCNAAVNKRDEQRE